MQFLDILIMTGVASLLGVIALFIYRSKKRGKACIGCPSGGNCERCNGSCQSLK